MQQPQTSAADALLIEAPTLNSQELRRRCLPPLVLGHVDVAMADPDCSRCNHGESA